MRPFVLCLLLSPAVFGWGKTGHRVVGQIAENHLSPKALQAVRNLLGAESLAEASNWGDEIRSDPSWRRAEPWHYVNIPEGTMYDKAPKNPKGDIISAIRASEATLRDGSAGREAKIEALKLLIHWVGDLHQPLHAGRADDLGGNRVSVRWFRGSTPTNLHTVWDSLLIDQEELSFTEWARFLDRAPRAQVKAWQNSDPLVWMEESRSALPQVYDFPPDLPLSYPYVSKNMPLVKQRLLQAGIRLAGLLNSIYR